MLNEHREQQLRDQHLDDGFLFPEYEGYCFANIPATVANVLDTNIGQPLPTDVFENVDTNVENVVLVLVDGFGYDRWLRDQDKHGFFSSVTEAGTVTPLTSIFSSQTAAALVTVHTGLTPAEHGLLGGTMYIEEAGFVLSTLAFSQKGGTAGDASEFVGKEALFRGDPIYPQLADSGVNAHTFYPEPVLGGAYAERKLAGSQQHGYENIAEMTVKLRKTLESSQGQNYFYTYIPHIDWVSHYEGRTSEEYQAQLAMISDCLQRELIGNLDRETAEQTLLLVTADHGHVNTDPAASIDLLSHDVIADSLRTDRNDNPIPPVGGPRYVHLHLQPDRIAHVQEYLSETFNGKVLSQEEAVSSGIFGDTEVSERTRQRCGDVIFIPRDDAAWYNDNTLSLDFAGTKKSTVGPISTHGGLSPQEMLVPFGAVGLSSL